MDTEDSMDDVENVYTLYNVDTEDNVDFVDNMDSECTVKKIASAPDAYPDPAGSISG